MFNSYFIVFVFFLGAPRARGPDQILLFGDSRFPAYGDVPVHGHVACEDEGHSALSTHLLRCFAHPGVYISIYPCIYTYLFMLYTCIYIYIYIYIHGDVPVHGHVAREDEGYSPSPLISYDVSPIQVFIYRYIDI